MRRVVAEASIGVDGEAAAQGASSVHERQNSEKIIRRDVVDVVFDVVGEKAGRGHNENIVFVDRGRVADGNGSIVNADDLDVHAGLAGSAERIDNRIEEGVDNGFFAGKSPQGSGANRIVKNAGAGEADMRAEESGRIQGQDLQAELSGAVIVSVG